MKKLMFLFVLMLAFAACNSQKKAVKNGVKEKVEIAADEDSTQYELIVMDPGYETFLATQPYPKEYYSDDYYRNWNNQYVIEWNYRHDHPDIYGDFYETSIDYRPSVDYGLDLNYRLYQYFQFIEQKYGIVLVPRRGKLKTR